MIIKPPRPRRGLTLVELLISIAIISILAAALLGVAARAGGVAREAKTKSMITRLHTLLMERYDQYRNVRVEPNTFTDSAGVRAALATDAGFLNITNTSATNGYPIGDPRIAAYVRLAALRELMKLEMPDRWSDILGGDVPTSLGKLPLSRSGEFLQETSPLYANYARAYNRVCPPYKNTLTGADNTRADIIANQSAECLYQIVTNATGDGEARSQFKEADSGDTDGDGLPEFLDGWGNPISFARWAPGFESDAQLSVTGLQRLYAAAEDDGINPEAAISQAIVSDHDPYDLFRLDNPASDLSAFDATTDALSVRGWRLVPLVYSSGPDAESGREFYEGQITFADPYDDADDSDLDIQRRGEAVSTDAVADNINNHQLATLSRTR